MKSSGDNGKGGEGRGLPVGVEWEATDYGAALCNGDGARIAEVSRKGNWTAMSPSGWALANGCAADGAAAQAAAEAALWRCDGFGVGEVRGRFVAHGQGFGLPGRWRLKAARAVPGGHEVDAVREGGVEVDAVRAPAPVDKAARAWASISQIGEDGSHPADGASEAAEADDHADGCAYYFADAGDADALCDCGKGEPAPRKPSAPADDGELARLLRGPDGARLDDDIATVRNHAPEIWSGTREHVMRVARACELLLAERAKTERRIAILTQTADAGEIAVGALERMRTRAEEAERERDYNYNLAVHVGKAFYTADRVAYGAAQNAWHEQTKWSDEDRARFAEMLQSMKEQAHG